MYEGIYRQRQIEKERKKNKELEEKLRLAKEKDLYGIKMIVSNETYNEYKGTLQDQIQVLQDRIDKAIEYMKEYCDIIETDKGYFIRSELTLDGLKDLFEILERGSNK